MPPSIEHRNVTPASVSLNVKLAVDEVVVPEGKTVIDGTGGGVVSIVKVVVVVLTLPTASVA